MISVAVVMPYHGEARFRVASWVRMRFELLHEEWRFVVGTDGGEPWTKARAVNRAVPDADVLIVTDADVLVSCDALRSAVRRVAAGVAWVVPYTTVYRLSQEQTAQTLAGSPAVDPWALTAASCVSHRPPYPATPGGGIFAVGRDAWEAVGGFDERFLWGQEDASLGLALDTLAGAHDQLDGPLWHLHHPPRSPTHQMYADQALEARYFAASGNRTRMAALVGQRLRWSPAS